MMYNTAENFEVNNTKYSNIQYLTEQYEELSA